METQQHILYFDEPVIHGTLDERAKEILTSDVMSFINLLHITFNNERLRLLQKRINYEKRIESGDMPYFIPDTKKLRDDPTWKVEPVFNKDSPILKREVDIVLWKQTDPEFFKECLRSGANGIQFDFDDSYSPTWENNIASQYMLKKYLDELTPESYKKMPVILVRPRSLNLDEKHITIGSFPLAGAFFDYGVWVYHYITSQYKNPNGVRDGPYFYLPKLESHEEAALWDEIFTLTEKSFDIKHGSIKAFIHIENVLASFQMEEMLFQLKDHCLGLNTGRWDYIFSYIKKFRHFKSFVVPDKSQLTMDKTFLDAWEKMLVDIAKKRGAFATGGMAPILPQDGMTSQDLLRLEKEVFNSKLREKRSGLVGALVAHPIFVNVCRNAFEEKEEQSGYQVLNVGEENLAGLLTSVPEGTVSMEGVKHNVNVVVNYMTSWLRGHGGCPLNGLVEDLATCEISRAHLWQWVKHDIQTVEGDKITPDLIMKLVREMVKSQKLDTRVVNLFPKLLDMKNFIDFLPSLLYDHIVIVKPQLLSKL